MTELMPAIFLGHGNPMNAIERNTYSDGWEAVGSEVALPKAILCISAHWYIRATSVTAMPAPRTIHDFGGFPKELYKVQYPAPGSPELAARVMELLSHENVSPDERWGLDHGTWSVLIRAFPKADIPVVQLSIDRTRPPGFHYELGKKLTALRNEGVLVVGSGNLVHNLEAYAWGEQDAKPFDWAVRFEDQIKKLIIKGEDEKAIEYEELGRDAMLSIPTPDHYLPLLYILGMRRKDDRISFPVQGIDGGSISMLAIKVG